MFNIDDKDLEQYQKNLDAVHKYAFPDTVRSTLSKEAFETSRQYKKNIKSELVIRGNQSSNIVLNSVHYEKAQYGEKDINKMESFVGQQSETYGKKTEQLRMQEFGETMYAKRSHIYKATKFTRGGNYKKLVPKDKLIARLQAKRIEDIAHHPVKGNIKKQFAQAVAVVHTTHKTINFIPDGETSKGKFGIFQFRDTGTKIKKDGTKVIKGHSGKQLYSFEGKSQKLHERPMLKPATDKIAPTVDKIFVEEAQRRLSKEMKKGLKA